MNIEMTEFHEMREKFHFMKSSRHSYQICSLGNSTMKMCIETNLKRLRRAEHAAKGAGMFEL